MKHILLLLSPFLLLCCGPSLRGKAAEDLQHVVGSALVVPATLQGRIVDRDTTIAAFDTLTPAKVLVYYNAEGCTPCKLKELFQWNGYMTECEADNSGLRFLYILNSANTTETEIIMTLDGCHFDHPVFYDNLGDFERLNPGLPANPTFHTFLLDRNNRVVLVGSPIGNPKMWTLYKQTIQQLATNDGQLSSAVPLP